MSPMTGAYPGNILANPSAVVGQWSMPMQINLHMFSGDMTDLHPLFWLDRYRLDVWQTVIYQGHMHESIESKLPRLPWQPPFPPRNAFPHTTLRGSHTFPCRVCIVHLIIRVLPIRWPIHSAIDKPICVFCMITQDTVKSTFSMLLQHEQIYVLLI